jgi:DNA-binding Lrp family transcriptional regulator
MLSEKDKLLLKELIEDSRQKIISLSRKCHMTRQSIYNKINEFRGRGIKFTVDVNPRELGLKVRAYTLVTIDPGVRFRTETDEIIKKFKGISQIHYLIGRFDIIVEIIVRDIDELSDLIRKISELPLVRKTETLTVYETVKLSHKDPLLRIL